MKKIVSLSLCGTLLLLFSFIFTTENLADPCAYWLDTRHWDCCFQGGNCCGPSCD